MLLAFTLATALTPTFIVTASANQTGNQLVGGFEIDGNYYEGYGNTSTAANPVDKPAGSVDWGTPVDSTYVYDRVGTQDTTSFAGGSESDPVTDWAPSTSGSTANPSADMGDVWFHDQIVDDDVYSYFAWDRPATTGSTSWFVELNQKQNQTNANGLSVPDRSVGDVRAWLLIQGGSLLSIRWYSWTGSAWTLISSNAGVGLLNDSPITVPDVRPRAVDQALGAQQFIEFGINFSELFGGNGCAYGGEVAVNIRSAAGPTLTSQLKDYMNVPVDIESRCGVLEIDKTGPDGNPVPGATFTITPNPIPGATAPSLTVTDGGANDSAPEVDGVIVIDPVEPGTYTVEETGVPPGYIGASEPETVTIETSGSVSVGFANDLGSLSWQKTDAETGDPVCCATFEVTATGGPAAEAPWNLDDNPIQVTDNEAGVDLDPDVGAISLGDLPVGTYTITEVTPPQGYDLADPASVEGVEISADSPDPTVDAAFADPQLLSELTIRKVDAEADPDEPLSGAVFQLYRDDGDGVPDAPDGSDEAVGDPCQTDANGECTVGDLTFGNYYWFEVSAPAGFELPTDRYSPIITIGPSNAGSEIPTYTFTNPRLPGELPVQKQDENGDPLGGAIFELYLDSNGNGEFDEGTGGDELIGQCQTPDPASGLDPAGSCSIADLDFGTYFWVETQPPTGYDLPDPNVSDPVVLNAGNVEDPPLTTFTDPHLLTPLTVLKDDLTSDDAIDGAEFALYRDVDGDGEDGVSDDAPDADDGSPVGSCVTGTDDPGTCTITGLDYGTYYWYETTAPEGYQLPADRTSVMITIDATNAGTEAVPIEYSDPRQISELNVRKLDGSDDAPLNGGVFALYSDDDGDGTGGLSQEAPDPDDSLIGTCATGVDADSGTPGLCGIGGLDFGTYYWWEVSAPPGYQLPDPRYSDMITIDADNAGTDLATITFSDPRITSALTVLKLDGTGSDPLSGAEFELYLDRDGDGEGGATDDAPDPDDAPAIGSCTTGEDPDADPGTCTISDLDFGTYYWYEVSAPTGYQLPDDRTSAMLPITALNAGVTFDPEPFRDPRAPSELSVIKIDAGTEEPLSGAVFQLYRDDGDGVGDVPDDGDEPIGDPCTTGADGICTVADLDFGDYYWYEASPPPGYPTPTDRTSPLITIDADNAGTDIERYTFTNPRLELTVQKSDAATDAPLAGAEFDLVLDDGDGSYEEAEDQVVDSCTTGDDGGCTIGDLEYGSYFWVETAPPTGYELPDPAVFGPVEVSPETSGDLPVTTVGDPQTPSVLIVQKHDASTSDPLPGGEFELYLDRDGDGADGVTDTAPDPDDAPAVGTCTTDDTGSCSVDDLGFGTYYWVETAAPTGYQLPADQTSAMITIDADNAGSQITPIAFSDLQIPSQLTVLKQDASTEDPLDGAEFSLYLDRDGDGQAGVSDVAADPDDAPAVGTCTTGNAGRCSVDDLGFGTYYWVETAAPTGYQLPADQTSTMITIDADNAGSQLTPFVFNDPQTRSELVVLKQDRTTSDPLSGAEFELYLDRDGDGADGVTDAATDPDDAPAVGTCSTDDTGTCSVDDLGFGTYYWFEAAAPTGYLLPVDRTSSMIIVDADNAGTQITPITFTDRQVLSELTVLKRDATTGQTLAGAEFDLVLDDGDGSYQQGADEVVDSCTTGDDGECTIDDLAFGTYFWVEVSAPTGYQLPDPAVSDPIVINAGNAGTEFTPYTVDDPQILTALSLQKVDSGTGETLDGAVFQLYRDDGDGVVGDEPGDGEVAVGPECTTGDDGSGLCTVDDLEFGDYFWYEVSPPAGYPTPIDRTSPLISITADNAGDSQTYSFTNPRLELSVRKLDATNNAPLAGGVFDLVLDDGDGSYQPDADQVLDSCTTDETGVCTVDGLDFGTYFWVEVQAPGGYQLPNDPVRGPVEVNPDTSGDLTTMIVRDPQVLSALAIQKVGEDTGETLPGADFELYRDHGDGVGNQPDAGDERVDACTTGSDGLCSVDGLPFGDYYWYETAAPQGYDLPEDRTSSIVTIDAGNAGQTQTTTFTDPVSPAPTPAPTPEPSATSSEAAPTSPPAVFPPAEGQLPNTGAGAGLTLAAIIGMLAIGAGGVVLFGSRLRRRP
ncbi:MAG TPA: SpaA isopeptide-forming pilin-related protein [Microlunatus sp.]